MKNFIVYAPSYDPDSGGCIVLHKLCDCLNRIGYQAFIYPMIPSFELNVGNAHSAKSMLTQMISAISRYENFKLNPNFLSPVLKPSFDDFASDDTIVVYPEVTFGNPLRAKNVVRWILYTPGETVPTVYYGFDELHFLFQEAFGKYTFPRCRTSNHVININYWPTEVYMSGPENTDRKGMAYCVRKSNRVPDKDIVSTGICIDGKTHHEVAEIFRNVKTFLSYDPFTAYSKLASLAGCDSVIIPIKDKIASELYPDPGRLDGVAYGFSDIDRARKTRSILVSKIRQEDERAIDLTRTFVSDVENYFGC